MHVTTNAAGPMAKSLIFLYCVAIHAMHAFFFHSSNTKFWTIQKPWRQFYLKIQNYGACVPMCAQFWAQLLPNSTYVLYVCVWCMDEYFIRPWITKKRKMFQLANKPFYMHSELSTFWRRNEINTHNLVKYLWKFGMDGRTDEWVIVWVCECESAIQKWITRFTNRSKNYFLRYCAMRCNARVFVTNFGFSSVYWMSVDIVD